MEKKKGKNESLADSRFAMVKKMHRGTFEKAEAEGKADRQLLPLCRFVAKTNGFFTSSGCAGRILLLGLKKGEDKKGSYFHRKWHRAVSLKEVLEGINEKTQGELWFRLDPFILHIGAKDLDGAERILKAMKLAGVKRGGITVAKPGKFLIELQGSQFMALPVKKGKKVLAEKSLMKFIVEKSNKKLKWNYERLKALEKQFRKELN
ncbi:MAG: hypothetical protein V1494_02595 [Candidatus Diapherotrites archaeon]